MELSYNGDLEGYVAVQGNRSPLNAGSFIVTPRDGLFQRVLDIVRRQRNQTTKFDKNIGRGHEISEKDPWNLYGMAQGGLSSVLQLSKAFCTTCSNMKSMVRERHRCNMEQSVVSQGEGI